jgi:hypothetical protein
MSYARYVSHVLQAYDFSSWLSRGILLSDLVLEATECADESLPHPLKAGLTSGK